MMRNLFRRLAFLAAIVLTLWMAVRWSTVHSDAFGYVSEKVRGATAVQERLGTVKDVKLAWLGRWHVSYTLFGEEGQATFSLSATGSGGTADLYVKVRNERASWRIVTASMDGEPIDLER